MRKESRHEARSHARKTEMKMGMRQTTCRKPDTFELNELDELWNEESESFATIEPVKKGCRARLPVSAHGRRGRPSQETRASSRVRHRISKQGGMHRRRRKHVR